MKYQKGKMMVKTYCCDGKRALFDLLNEQICFRDIRPDVVFIGDSITEMFDPAVWFPECGFIVNRGIGGDVAEGVRFRFDWDVIQLQPKVCVAMIGVNNIGDLDTMAVNMLSESGNYEALREQIPKIVKNELLPCYEEIAEKCEKAGISLIFCAITPVSHDLSVGFDYRNLQIDLLNEGIREIAARHGIPFCDFSVLFKDELGQCRSDITLDRLHPNCLGYEKMTEMLRPLLKKALILQE